MAEFKVKVLVGAGCPRKRRVYLNQRRALAEQFKIQTESGKMLLDNLMAAQVTYDTIGASLAGDNPGNVVVLTRLMMALTRSMHSITKQIRLAENTFLKEQK